VINFRGSVAFPSLKFKDMDSHTNVFMNIRVYEYVQIDATYNWIYSGNSGLFIRVIKIISLDSLILLCALLTKMY
jgi:hypothetical protein